MFSLSLSYNRATIQKHRVIDNKLEYSLVLEIYYYNSLLFFAPLQFSRTPRTCTSHISLATRCEFKLASTLSQVFWEKSTSILWHVSGTFNEINATCVMLPPRTFGQDCIQIQSSTYKWSIANRGRQRESQTDDSLCHSMWHVSKPI